MAHRLMSTPLRALELFSAPLIETNSYVGNNYSGTSLAAACFFPTTVSDDRTRVCYT